jgi:SAM-dependent methyltransferase
MWQMTSPYIKARDDTIPDLQERNRKWWETLPMTYKPWSEGDRSTTQQRLVVDFLSSNPFLSYEFFQRFTDKDVLEIGCGAGAAALLFARNGARVTAIDLTEQAISLTRQNTQGLPVEMLRMDAESLSFPRQCFDYVFSWGVLHHSSRPERAFQEVERVLRPGGAGLVMVYHRHSLRYYIRGLQYLILHGKMLKGETLESVQKYFTDGYFHRHYTKRELQNALYPLQVDKLTTTHMSKPLLSFLPRTVDNALKSISGWLLVAEFHKGR